MMLLLLFGVTFAAQAQLGKLKDRATNEVNKKKDKAVRDAKNDIRNAENSAVEKLTEKPAENTKNSSNANSNTNTNSNNSNKSSNTNSSSVSTPNVSQITVEFATDFIFKNKKNNFEPGEEIFVRLIAPKPLGEIFKEAFKMSDIPFSGSMAIAIAKNADDENPIVVAQYSFFPNRYKDDKQFAVTLQIDDSKLEKLPEEAEGKVPFNSIQTLAKGDLKMMWEQEAAKFAPNKYQWTIFFFFRKANSEDIAEAGSGVFTYNVTNENRGKLVSGMNFSEKAKYETVSDNGVKTDFHKKNIGKLAFAKSNVSDDGTGVQTTFTNPSAGIYAKAFMAQSIKNWYALKGKGDSYSGELIARFIINGKEYLVEETISKEEIEKATTIGFALCPTNEKDNNWIAKMFIYILSTLPAGKHKIDISVRVQDPRYDYNERYLLGEGSLEVTINPAERDGIVKKYGSVFYGNLNTYPDKELAALIKQNHPALAHKITNEEIVRNAFGQVTHRMIDLKYVYKDEKGDYIVGLRVIKQDFIGNQWAKSLPYRQHGPQYYVPIINVKP